MSRIHAQRSGIPFWPTYHPIVLCKTPSEKIYNTPTLPKVPHIELYTTPEPEEVCTHDVLHTPLIYPRSLKSSTLHSNY